MPPAAGWIGREAVVFHPQASSSKTILFRRESIGTTAPVYATLNSVILYSLIRCTAHLIRLIHAACVAQIGDLRAVRLATRRVSLCVRGAPLNYTVQVNKGDEHYGLQDLNGGVLFVRSLREPVPCGGHHYAGLASLRH